MTTEKEPKTHVYLKPCGCVSSLIIDKPERYEELGRLARYAWRHGESYFLMETAAVRTMEWECPAHKKVKTKP